MKSLLFFLLLCAPVLLSAQPKVNYKKKGADIPPFGIERTNGQPMTNTVLQLASRC